MKVSKTLYGIFAWLCIAACEETVNVPSESEQTDLIVVEAILTNEPINHRVKLSLPYQSQNEDPIPVTGAAVTVIEQNTIYTLTEFPTGSGEYYTPVMRAVTGRRYGLVVNYKGKQYYAYDSPPPVEPLSPIKIEKADQQFTIRYSDSGQDPNFINYDISWANTEACSAAASCEGKIVYYDLKTIDVNEVYKPKQEEFKFPRHSVIIRKKYSVSPVYKAFLRTMLSETRWRGGVFDVQQENTATNLSKGATGFFAVSSVVSDTTIVSE